MAKERTLIFSRRWLETTFKLISVGFRVGNHAEKIIPGLHVGLYAREFKPNRLLRAVAIGPKGGPKAVMGKWDETGEPGITFPDGNKWTLKDKK
jgi:hypothetical protein